MTAPQTQQPPISAIRNTYETRARVFSERRFQSRKLPNITVPAICANAETSDAKARERMEKYRERYELLYGNIQLT
ncbi:hypothetical protein ColLi_10819 [Colletotrichum liriopes]|uniref:Uncharacterized protein n=1 Tax=Colletotrichum liriopes TaxID=708192 RepID=A0AA37GX38_9PEZI|nr:hypothetical protein ColLi_10819 [Colletotrichum liriopes]